MNYYPFHLGDYTAHTSHLELLEDLAYRRLLDLYYLKEELIPLDIQETARLIRMKAHTEDVETVLREFFKETESGWRHSRCDEEIAHMQDKQEKAKASAAASVKARQANAQRTLNERSTEVELPTPTPTPTPTPKEKLPPLPPTGGRQAVRSFKTWNAQDFRLEIGKANTDILSAEEAEEFFAYWTEPNGNGRPRFSLEKTWDTARRMKNAVAMIYSKRRAPPQAQQQRFTPRQQQMRDIADMRNKIEARENGTEISRCPGGTGETLLALPGGRA